MKEADLVSWLEALMAKRATLASNRFIPMLYEARGAAAWVAEAESALAAGFPTDHPCRRNWTAVFQRAQRLQYPQTGNPVTLDEATGVLAAALEVARAGRLTPIYEGIRAETVSELLDQAQVLLNQGYSVAATVISGGALETHLLHLCNRHQLQWPGDGSISKYNNTIGRICLA
jgi:hypothetical protein